jgi:hypothetical protein
MALKPLPLKESSSIAAAAYDPARRILRVTFTPGRAAHRGGSYEYLEVPEDVVEEFLKAPSLGQFVNWQIKPHYEYRKVG